MMTEHMTKAEAYMTIHRLLVEHNRSDWKIAWDRKAKTAGSCNHTTQTITMSTLLLDRRPYMDSLNTCTHEVAHAIAGPFAKHGMVWRKIHMSLGGDGERYHTFKDEKAPWMADCGDGCTMPFYRKPTRRYRCKAHKLPMVLVDQRQSTIAAQKRENDGLPIHERIRVR